MTLSSPIHIAEVEKEILTEQPLEKELFTLIHCSYWSPFDYLNGGWVQISNTTYLQNEYSDERLPPLHALAVPVAPQKY